MSVIPKGQEPERIKKRMDILFAKLDEAYPDKVIIYLQRDHKKWSETARELYRLLGYEDNKSFLEAYGYIYERANGGRSNAFDPNELINTLKEKYQDSPKRKSIGELMFDNPEIKGNLKTLQNKAPELFGMSLAKYLKDLGILSASKPKETPKSQRVKKKKLYHYLVVSVEGFTDNIICATDVRTATEGSVVEICKINSDEKYRGNVIETHYFNEEENLPMPIDEMYQCIRRITNAELKEIEASKIKYIFCSVQIKDRDDTLYYISPFEDVDIGDIVEVPHNWYGTVLGTITNIEHVSEKTAPYSVKRTKKIETIIRHTNKELSEINNSANILCNQFGTTEFSYIPVDKNVIELYEKMTYFSSVVFRGIDIDVHNALTSLYHDDINPLERCMKLENGFSQFECTSSEVPRIIKEFPDLKALFFAENWKEGKVYLAYSESGYNSVTSMRLIGFCDFYCRDRWSLMHDPSEETFEEGDVKYSFEEMAKWEKCNYVLADGNRCLAKTTPLYSKPYPKAKTGDACEVIEICYPENEELYVAPVELTKSSDVEKIEENDDLSLCSKYSFRKWFDMASAEYIMTVSIKGTEYEGRAARFEYIDEGDIITLKADYNNKFFTPVAIECFNSKNETLGYISATEDILKECARALEDGVLGAKVASVTPLSKCGKDSKSVSMDIKLYIVA